MIQSISSLSDFENVCEEWNTLYETLGVSNLFLSHQWLCNWIKHFGDNRWVALLEWAPDNKVLSAATVMRTNDRRVGFIEPYHSHYPGILELKENTASLTEILSYIQKVYRPKVVELPQSPRENSFLQKIKQSSGKKWFILEKFPHTMRVITIGDSLDSYLATRNKKIRHELTRKKKRLQTALRPRLCCLDQTNELDKLFDAIEDIERDSWKLGSGTAIISSEVERNFYKNVFKTYSSTSTAKAYILYTENIPMSYVVGVVFNGKYYALKTSYKKNYAQFSPGVMLFLYIIEELCSSNEGISKIELLGSDSRWKKELGTDGKTFCTYALYPISISSSLYIVTYKFIRPIVKSWFTKNH